MTLTDQAGDMVTLATDVEYALADHDYASALRRMNLLADAFSELCADIAHAAYNQGMTKKAIAGALEIPPSALRGMVRQGAPA